MSSPTQTKTWVLANHPSGLPTTSGDKPTFSLATKDLPSELSEGQILVKTLYLSNDPAQRGWIADNIPPERLYVPPVQVGQAMRARGIGEVVVSKSSKFSKGDLVLAAVNWTEYAVVKDSEPGLQLARPLPNGLSPTHYLGALGLTGLTAYYGLVEVAKCKKGDRVIVSGAAGATGSMVVQIAKNIVGASYVVGIAGSEEKCKWVEELGADKCLNYKSSSFESDLKAAAAAAPSSEGTSSTSTVSASGFDVYFDNVGGEILDAVLARMARNGRVAVCGAIAGYNDENPASFKNWFNVISMRIDLQGFIVLDYMAKMPEVVGKFVEAIKAGKLKVDENFETVVNSSFEDVPQTWLKLFQGGNTGKLVTKL